MTAHRPPEGVRAYGRSADAFETVAWRAPSSVRFDGRAANDSGAPEPALEAAADLRGWIPIVAGGLIAGLMGALLGGALSL